MFRWSVYKSTNSALGSYKNSGKCFGILLRESFHSSVPYCQVVPRIALRRIAGTISLNLDPRICQSGFSTRQNLGRA